MKLTKQELSILKDKATEPPFTGKLLHNKESGTYHCKFCNTKIFSSKSKYDSKSGWPSFTKASKFDCRCCNFSSYYRYKRSDC